MEKRPDLQPEVEKAAIVRKASTSVWSMATRKQPDKDGGGGAGGDATGNSAFSFGF